MLVAELVSEWTVEPGGPLNPLSFGSEIWSGDDDGKEDCRRLRAIVYNGDLDGQVQGWETIVPDVMGGKDSVSAQVLPVVPSPKLPSAAAPKRDASEPSKRPPKKKSAKIQIISSTTSSDPQFVQSDDDELTPYALPEEAESEPDDADLDDPSIAMMPSKAKVRPPVYIVDLSAYLRSTEDAERIQVGLREAEALIRRKWGWGTELGD
jgi:telomere length regulation protein